MQKPEIHQRYGGELGALADELKAAGVTHVIVPVFEGGTAFYPSDVLPQRWEYGTELLAFRHALRGRNIDFVAYVSIFQDAYTYYSQPLLRAVDDLGTRNGSEENNWICPSAPAYRDYKLKVIEEVMLILQPEGIYLDKLSFPMEIDDIFSDAEISHSRDYCFCSTCLNSFASYAGIDLPESGSPADINHWLLDNYQHAWMQWKTGTITDFMEDVQKRIHSINPQCKIMLSVPPWKEEDHHFGRQRLAGQDVKTLAPFLDHFILKTSCSLSDESYEEMRLSLIGELEDADAVVIPSIQLEIDPLHTGEKDFKDQLHYFKPRVIVSNWAYLLKNRRYLNIFITEPY